MVRRGKERGNIFLPNPYLFEKTGAFKFYMTSNDKDQSM